MANSSRRFACEADKEGGGTSFLFGRKSWKRRYVVVEPDAGVLAYYDSQLAFEGGARPLKPTLLLAGATALQPPPENGRHDVELKWEGAGERELLRLSLTSKLQRDKLVAALVAAGAREPVNPLNAAQAKADAQPGACLEEPGAVDVSAPSAASTARGDPAPPTPVPTARTPVAAAAQPPPPPPPPVATPVLPAVVALAPAPPAAARAAPQPVVAAAAAAAAAATVAAAAAVTVAAASIEDGPGAVAPQLDPAPVDASAAAAASAAAGALDAPLALQQQHSSGGDLAAGAPRGGRPHEDDAAAPAAAHDGAAPAEPRLAAPAGGEAAASAQQDGEAADPDGPRPPTVPKPAPPPHEED